MVDVVRPVAVCHALGKGTRKTHCFRLALGAVDKVRLVTEYLDQAGCE